MGDVKDIKIEYLGSCLPFWSDIADECRTALCEHSRTQRCRRGSVIHNSSGDLGVILVRRGRICIYTASEEGRELVLMRIFAGGVCLIASEAMMAGADMSLLVGAESEADIVIIESGVYAELCRNYPAAAEFTRSVLVCHLAAVAGNMQSALLHSAERRIAAYLLGESERTGSSRVRTTHEQIARNVGTAREVVSRTLARLAASGALSPERGSIIIQDMDELKKLI